VDQQLEGTNNLLVSNRNDRAFVATEETTRFPGRQANSLKKTVGCLTQLRLMGQLFREVFNDEQLSGIGAQASIGAHVHDATRDQARLFERKSRENRRM